MAGVWRASPWPVLAWAAVMVASFLAFALRARSLRKPAYYFLEWAVTSPMTTWGFIRRPLPPERFASIGVPYEWVKRPPSAAGVRRPAGSGGAR